MQGNLCQTWIRIFSFKNGSKILLMSSKRDYDPFHHVIVAKPIWAILIWLAWPGQRQCFLCTKNFWSKIETITAKKSHTKKEYQLLTDSLCMKAIFWSLVLMHSKLPFWYYMRRMEPSLWHTMVLSKMYYLLSNIFSPYFWWSGDPFYDPPPDRAKSPVRKITLQTWQLGHWYLRHAKMPTQYLLRLLPLLMLMLRIILATVWYKFGRWRLVLKLNFCSDFEHKGWSRFWSWSLYSILPLMFCRGYEVESWSRFWS